MRKNRIGAMFIVSVLALAGIGISYAGWTDTITIGGTVETGDVDLNVEYYSGTWVYKMPEHGLERIHAVYTADQLPDNTHTPPADKLMLVASAWAEPTTVDGEVVDDSVTITFDNLFPCQDFEADFIAHYVGSIPARIVGSHYITTENVHNGDQWTAQYGGGDWMEDLWACAHGAGPDGFGIWIEAYRCHFDDTEGWVMDEPVDNGVQVHDCNYLWFKVIIHIPQNNAYQDCSGAFSMDLTAIQWDRYSEIAP